MINIDLHILVEKVSEKTRLFQKNFRMYVKEIFILWDEHKRHNLTNHIYRFKNMIKMNHQKEITQRLTKRQIYYVDFGINVWTEINGTRPALVYKASKKTYGEDILVIPMTGYTDEKSMDEFDVKLDLEACTFMSKPSIIKTRQIRCISKKRLGNYIGKITTPHIKDSLQENIIRMMGMKIQKNSPPK